MEISCWLRSCSRCSSSWPPIDLLCETCWRKISPSRKTRPRELFQNSITVLALWDWTPQSSDIGNMVKARKNSRFDLAHRRLAKMYLRDNGEVFVGAQSLVYPTKTPGKKDHTSSLAKAFSDLLQIPATEVELMVDEGYRHQKQKERLASRRAKRIAFKNRPPGPHVMIDDVLTTGATAKAVWRALGKPPHFKVAVLAYKTKLGGLERL